MRRGLGLLKADGFYGHMSWTKVSPHVKAEIIAIGDRVGSRLWDLDEKLAALLDDEAAARPAGWPNEVTGEGSNGPQNSR